MTADHSERRTCAALFFTASFLRFYHLGRQSFWWDEIFTLRNATLPFRQIHHAVDAASPPLFDYLLRIVYGIVGSNDFWLRCLPALIGAVTIPVFYGTCRRLLSPSAAFWGAALLTISPFHVAYSQELRMYTLVTLEALLSLYFWEQSLEHQTTKAWIGYVLSTVSGLYTHNWFLFLTASQAIGYAAWCIRHKHGCAKGWMAFGLIGMAYAPWIPLLMAQTRVNLGYIPRPGAAEVLQTFYALSGSRVTVGDGTFQLPFEVSAAILVPALFCLGLGYFSSGLGRGRARRLFWVGCLIPLLFAFLYSRLIKPIYLPSRYTLITLPAFLLLAARGLGGGDLSWPGRRRAILSIVGLLWIGSCSVLLIAYYRLFVKGSWREMMSWVVSRARPGDAVVIGPLGNLRMTIDYYLPPQIDRQGTVLSDKTHQRLFVPSYGQYYAGPHVILGPKTSAQWESISARNFSHGSIVLLQRKKRGSARRGLNWSPSG